MNAIRRTRLAGPHRGPEPVNVSVIRTPERSAVPTLALYGPDPAKPGQSFTTLEHMRVIDAPHHLQYDTGDFAEINIGNSLISVVSSLVEQKDAEFSQLLKGLHQVHVNVVALTDENRADF